MRSIDVIKEAIKWGDSNHGVQLTLHDELRAALTADIPLERLEQICKAERDGRCVVLPCKVGETVWFVPCHNWAKEIYEPISAFRVSMVTQKSDGSWFWRCTGKYQRGGTAQCEFKADAIGKTVFLTRADAEAKGAV